MTAARVVRDWSRLVERKWWVAGAVVLLAGASLVVVLVRPTPLRTSEPTSSTTTTIQPVAPLLTIQTLRHSLPERLAIPALGVDTRVGTLGLQPDGQIMVPSNARYVGWFRFGPTPGQVGSSTILGHVDSFRGPGVFFNLKNLKPGDTLSVQLASHAVAHFVVLRVVEYSKSAFPDQLVYGPHGTRDLNLITCGGVFDRATGHYESNIVVFSRLTRVSGTQKA